jgi:hypothetical protein
MLIAIIRGSVNVALRSALQLTAQCVVHLCCNRCTAVHTHTLFTAHYAVYYILCVFLVYTWGQVLCVSAAAEPARAVSNAAIPVHSCCSVSSICSTAHISRQRSSVKQAQYHSMQCTRCCRVLAQCMGLTRACHMRCGVFIYVLLHA